MDDSEIQALHRLEAEHWWYENRRKILQAILEGRSKSIRILDLGSASGSNTLFIKGLGFDSVLSVEQSRYGCNLQRERGIPVIEADICKLPFDDESYDLIVCMDVIEHIKEDVDALHEMHRVLVKDGEILISVPEDPRLWSKHDLAVKHFRRYSRQDLMYRTSQSGLQTKVMFSSHFLLKPIIKLFRKFSTGSDLKPVHPPINLILKGICLLERKLGFGKFPGTTLWAVLRKP